ncbi:hypothetical protein CE206_29455 (plasmid) [Achromobacter xylosoxidans]|uniref:hypothetical protein n=1 Tax=Alcaligenes xylosoxydans xylosoxydans TaxID=85698 RepID=UPI000DD15B5A|nr:hypothetical protein [Achromobacter xylosoxidans]AXA80695.1 hypothetical protein CE206_29455 [Achromobacter xylosoxidans]
MNAANKKKREFRWRRTAVATALAMTVSTAAAAGGGYVADSYAPMIYQGVQQTLAQLQNVVAAIQNARDAIVDAIYKSTGSQTEALTNAIAKGSELDSQTTRQTQVELERARRDAALEQANGCSVTARSKSGGAGSGAKGSGGRYGGGGAPVKMTGNSSVSKVMATAIDRGNGLEPAPSTNKQIEDTAQGACETYAAGDPLREKWCRDAGFGVGNLTGFIQADVRAETLFDGPQTSKDAQGFKHQRTLGVTGKELDALNSFIYHLEKPQQIEDPQTLDMKTREGKGYLALKTTFDARISMGSKPTRDYVGVRSPDKETIPMLQQLTADPVTGAWVSQYLQKSTPNWASTGISVEELEHLELERRYLNPAWQLDFASQFDPAVIAREAALISLGRYDIEVKALQEQRKTNMLLGQIYNSLTRVEMREIMNGVREQAKDAATAVE